MFCPFMLRAAFICVLLLVFCEFSRGESNPLGIRLVSEDVAIVPGRPFYVGLHLQHQPGDHTYWKCPGIVGVPTGIEWKLPKGFAADPIEWPEPHLVHMYQIKAQGYEGEVILPIRIRPPKTLSPGESVTLQGQATWMCCGRTCNPGLKDLSLALPVAESAAPSEKWHAKFEAARAAVPRKLEGWRQDAVRAHGEVTLTLTATGADTMRRADDIKEMIFFTDDGLINADKEQIFFHLKPGVVGLRLQISQYASDPRAPELCGVLQTPQGWTPDGAVKSMIVRARIVD